MQIQLAYTWLIGACSSRELQGNYITSQCVCVCVHVFGQTMNSQGKTKLDHCLRDIFPLVLLGGSLDIGTAKRMRVRKMAVIVTSIRVVCPGADVRSRSTLNSQSIYEAMANATEIKKKTRKNKLVNKRIALLTVQSAIFCS